MMAKMSSAAPVQRSMMREASPEMMEAAMCEDMEEEDDEDDCMESFAAAPQFKKMSKAMAPPMQDMAMAPSMQMQAMAMAPPIQMQAMAMAPPMQQPMAMAQPMQAAFQESPAQPVPVVQEKVE